MTLAKKRWMLNAGLAILAGTGAVAWAQNPSGPPVMQGFEIAPSGVPMVHEIGPVGRVVEETYPNGHAGGTCKERCRSFFRERMWGYLSEYQPAPFGAALYANMGAQVNNGEGASMILHHLDFEYGKATLNQHGLDNLYKILHLAPKNFYPIVIERVPGNPKLEGERRAAVLSELAKGHFPVAAERVVVGPRTTRGITGVEADLINGIRTRDAADNTWLNGLMKSVQEGTVGKIDAGGFAPGSGGGGTK